LKSKCDLIFTKKTKNKYYGAVAVGFFVKKLRKQFYKKAVSGAFKKSDAIPEVKIVFERKREKRF